MIYIPCPVCGKELTIEFVLLDARIHVHEDNVNSWQLRFWSGDCKEPGHLNSCTGTTWEAPQPCPYPIQTLLKVYQPEENVNLWDCFQWSDPEMVRDALLSAGVPEQYLTPREGGEQ